MGCGASRETLSPMETPLNHVMKVTGVDAVDSVFRPISPIIEHLEKIRVSLVDAQDDLLESSGAMAYKETNLAKIISGLFQRVSALKGGDLKKANLELTLQKPYIKVGDQGLAGVLKDIIPQFVDYISGIIEISDSVTEIVQQITDLVQTLPDKTGDLIEQVKDSASSDPFQAIKNVAAVTKNSMKATVALKRSAEISVFAAKQIASLKDAIALLHDDVKIAAINEIGKKAISKKLQEPVDIVWEFALPIERHGATAKECLKILKTKKEKREKLLAEIKKEETEGPKDFNLKIKVAGEDKKEHNEKKDKKEKNEDDEDKHDNKGENHEANENHGEGGEE